MDMAKFNHHMSVERLLNSAVDKLNSMAHRLLRAAGPLPQALYHVKRFFTKFSVLKHRQDYDGDELNAHTKRIYTALKKAVKQRRTD
ncbi:MAG: hypothetical protein L7F77_13475 [Candidatus Magnetominusculus sp. LBB02]|nr:hypothetical protein [Candidatus Magnetominusculus sp. LBB02]